MSDLTVCDTKIFYDTEFEAKIAAAKNRYDEMVEYPCGTHWHITHANPDKRRGAGKKHFRCPHCKGIFKRTREPFHSCPEKEALHGA